MEIISHRTPWKPTILVPISDVQYGSSACSGDRFKRWLSRIFEAYDNKNYTLLFLGLGDYTDSIRPSIRAKLRASGADNDEHIETGLLTLLEEHMDGFLDLVDGTKGKWLGMLEGHHYYDYGNGVTSDTKLAEKLEAPFLGDCARIHLLFDREILGNKGATTDFQIWCHHGEGGGNTPGAALNKLNPIKAQFEADCFLMAHQHKAATTKVPYCYDVKFKGKYKMVDKDISLTATGGWLAGYMQGSRSGFRPGGNYPEQKMLTPLSLGGTRVYMEPRHGNSRDWIYHEVTV